MFDSGSKSLIIFRPWLFTAALVLAVGILGRSGLLCDDTCKASIECLDYFGAIDPHARQYSIIVQSLLKITTKHVKQRESDIRLQRKQASSELFGLISLSPAHRDRAATTNRPRRYSRSEVLPSQSQNSEVNQGVPPDWTMYDADFFAMPWSNENDQGLQDFLQPGAINLEGATVADIPLFPIYDQQTGVSFP